MKHIHTTDPTIPTGIGEQPAASPPDGLKAPSIGEMSEWTMPRLYDLCCRQSHALKEYNACIERYQTELDAARAAQANQPQSHATIGKLIESVTALEMLWGLNEPGALVRVGDVSNVLFAASRAAASTAVGPAILEALSYHANERDDLTLADAVTVVRSGWRTVAGRTERAMVLQIAALLAGAPDSTTDAVRFSAFLGTLLADINGEALTPLQQEIKNATGGKTQMKTLDALRAAIDIGLANAAATEAAA